MNNLSLLSICVTCRDNHDDIYEHRGGARFARKVFDELGTKRLVNIRGVQCMSNCKRACILSLTSSKGFTYMFGNINPNNSEYVSSLRDLVAAYESKVDGFLHRTERPPLFRSNIVARVPPIDYVSPMITKFKSE